MTQDEADAYTLRVAAGILYRRSRRKTFVIRVVICVLERSADRIREGHDTVDG